VTSDESPAAVRARLEREIEYLADQLNSLESRMPTEAEIAHWREMALADERLTWARTKLRLITPLVVAFVVAVWGIVDWVSKHINWKG